jgi:hypothetical protein
MIVRICRCRKFCLSSLKLLLLKDMLLLLKHKREEMLGKTRATEERAVDVQAARPRAHNKARGLTRKRRSAQQTLRGANRYLGVHWNTHHSSKQQRRNPTQHLERVVLAAADRWQQNKGDAVVQGEMSFAG